MYGTHNLNWNTTQEHVGGDIDKTYENRHALNMLSILRLEQMKPGICKRLAKANNIYAFYRYPPELLVYLDELSERQSSAKRKSLVLIGAFDSRGESQTAALTTFKKLRNLEKHEIQPLLYEISSLEELNTIVSQIDSQTKEHVFQMVFQGHGGPNSLGLSDYNSITSDDIKNGEFPRVLQSFPQLKNILLSSCSSGESKGFAHALSNSLHIPVHAVRFFLHDYYRRIIVHYGRNGITMLKNPIGVTYHAKPPADSS